MKLFVISIHSDENWWFLYQFDGAVVCAENEEEAKRIHPASAGSWWNDDIFYDEKKKKFMEGLENGRIIDSRSDDCWTNNLDEIKVEYIGEAKPGLKKGVILSSFNSG